MVAFAGMAGGGLNVGIKPHQFFNATTLKQAVNKAEYRYLRRAGGLTRRIARTGIKKKGGARKEPKEFRSDGSRTKAWVKWRTEKQERPASMPGMPPHTHSERPVALRNAIRWGLSSGRQSSLVGPYANSPQTANIWKLHEFGGTRRLWVIRIKGKGPDDKDMEFVSSWPSKGTRAIATPVTARYEPRPFMGTALTKVTPQLPKLWKDSVR